jgi:uncharacterized protein YceK
MRMKTALIVMAGILMLFFGLQGCASTGGSSTPYEGYSNVYLHTNIHGYTRNNRGNMEYLASYANYVQPDTGHFFVPVNTVVSVGKWRGGFTMTRQDNGQLIYFEYRAANMAGMSVQEYLNLITGPQPLSMNSFSGTDLKGIKEGRALNGMTKKGVEVAWGYPAKHKTPSLEDNVWTYWRNRWVMKTVTFSNGKVTGVQ